MHRSGVAMAWNVFQFWTTLQGLGSIMIFLVHGVVGVTYYVVILTHYGPTFYDGSLDSLIALAILILFHYLIYVAVVVLLITATFMVKWAMCAEDGPSLCVWVVNCVGTLDYKYFLLFLFYTFLETSLVTLSLLPYLRVLFSDGEIPGTPSTLATTFLAFVVFALFTVLNLAVALTVMMFVLMHIRLVAANTTTIEAYEKKTSSKWRYDLGQKKNFDQVFGMDKQYWFIPAYSNDDIGRMPELQGLEYPSKPDFDLQF